MTVDVVVLLNTRWPHVASFTTRWREVVCQWADHRRVRTVVVVDHPWRNRRALVAPRRQLARPAPSWHPRVRRVEATVPLGLLPSGPGGRQRSTTEFVGHLAWQRVANALDRAIEPPATRRLVVAASPLWAPVLSMLTADHTAFDAVDDWTARRGLEGVVVHVGRGYEAAAAAGSRTAVSAPLAARLQAATGARYDVVGNGVNLAAYTGPMAPAPAGTPDGPFVLYVGTIEGRVDLDLLDAVADNVDVPVVVAGPATDAAQRLTAGKLQWLGPIPADLVPGLVRRASVGLVPHRVDELTTSMDPMKVHTYLAAGLPVVATPLPGLADLSPLVHVAGSPDAFASAVLAQLEAPRGRAATARHHCPPDWAEVADRLLDLYLTTAPAMAAPQGVRP